MADSIKKIIEFQTNVSDFQAEIENIKKLINDVVSEDISSKTFAELEQQAHEIEAVLSILAQHGMDSTVEFSKLESKMVEIAEQAKLIDSTVGRLTDTTFADLHNSVGDVKSEMQLLQESIQDVLSNDTKSQTFEQLIAQQKVLNDLLKHMKKEGLDNTKQYEDLQKKFEEIRHTSKQIGDNLGWSSGDTFNSLSEKMGNVMQGTHQVADGMSIMSQQADTTSGSMGKLYNSIDFLDRTTTLPISGALGEVTGLFGFATQAMSEFNGANNAAQRAMEQANKAQDALNKATEAGQNTTELATRAQNAMAAAQEATTTKTKQFRLALMSIGIGIFVLLLGQLIENWDKISKALDKLLPAGSKVADVFGKIIEVAMGVGNALVQYFIAPIKGIISLIQGDFKKAMDDFKAGMDVVNNYQSGAAKGRKMNDDDRLIKILENDIKQLEKQEKLYQAQGNDAAARVSTLKKNAKVQKKAEMEGNMEALSEARFEEKVTREQWKKEDEDKAKQARDKANQEAKQKADKEKQAAEERRRFNAEIEQSITDMTTVHASAREKDLYEWSKQYEAKKMEAKKIGADLAKIEEENNLKIAQINNKYKQAALEQIKKDNEDELNEFDKKKLEIEKKYNSLIQNLGDTDEQTKQQLIQQRNKQLEDVEKERQKRLAELAEAELQRVYDLEVRKKNLRLQIAQENADTTIDTNANIDAQLNALDELNTARVEQENAFFDAEKLRVKDHNDELLLLEQTHAQNLIQIEKDKADQKKKIQQAERQAQGVVLGEMGKTLTAFSGLMEESTLGHKALSIAAASIDTIQSGVATYKSFLTALPAPYNMVAGAIAAAGVVASGIAQVKKIASVKVGRKGGSTSIPSMSFDTANFSAPQIDAQQATGNGDVRITNPDDIIVKTYILDSDLDDAERRKQMMDDLSGF